MSIDGPHSVRNHEGYESTSWTVGALRSRFMQVHTLAAELGVDSTRAGKADANRRRGESRRWRRARRALPAAVASP